MSEKPQHSREGVPDEDVIGQVFSKALDKSGRTFQEEAPAEEASPAPEAKSEEKASRAEKKNKRSATYIYLLILFGAAFFMLLLAYFVQQRSSETTISDLRDSMNLSREELMTEIEGLKQEKETAEKESAQLQEELDTLKAQLDELQAQYDDTAGLSATQEKELQCWLRFWTVEADFLAGDYESCAQFFRTLPADNVPYPMEPGVQERVEEIYAELVERGVLTEGEGWMANGEPEEQQQG